MHPCATLGRIRVQRMASHVISVRFTPERADITVNRLFRAGNGAKLMWFIFCIHVLWLSRGVPELPWSVLDGGLRRRWAHVNGFDCLINTLICEIKLCL